MIPEALRPGLLRVLEAITFLTEQVRKLDREIESLIAERYPEAMLLRQVKGVGPVTSLSFVLTLEDPERFERSRDVGAYLGLVPKQRQSGSRVPQLGITKQGAREMRKLLVGSANYILGPKGPDTRLRRWGLAYAARGGKNARKRAVVAVARKLAVLLHRLWVTGEVYEPLWGLEAEERATSA